MTMPPPSRRSGSDKKPQGEFGLIGWIRQQVTAGHRTIVGMGDDCAVLRFPPGTDVLVTTDMLMDGRHFHLKECTPILVGYKALAVNLSDIAAMAGVPSSALVSVALPRKGAIEIAEGILEGMLPLAGRFGVDLVGGDTNAWDGPLVVSLALLGEATPPGPVKRSGARPGDAILVTGPLGGSSLGRHLKPHPRVAEALALQRSVALRAMIDISDGLASDLAHILEESGGLGAILDDGSIPIHPDAIALSLQDGRPVLDHALNDGEDFELCFVIDQPSATWLLNNPMQPAALPQLGAGTATLRALYLDEAAEPMRLHRIGEVTRETGMWLRLTDGSLRPIQPHGFDHLAGNDG